MATKTPEEIQAAKEAWHRDPCYDLWTAEGFEEHEKELRSYQHMVERENELRRPWQVWINYGMEGWQPKGFHNQEAAVAFMTSGEAMAEVVLTRLHSLTSKESVA